MCAHGGDVPLLSVLTLIHYIIIMKIMIEKEHKDLVGRTHFGAKQSILLSPRIHNFQLGHLYPLAMQSVASKAWSSLYHTAKHLRTRPNPR